MLRKEARLIEGFISLPDALGANGAIKKIAENVLLDILKEGEWTADQFDAAPNPAETAIDEAWGMAGNVLDGNPVGASSMFDEIGGRAEDISNLQEEYGITY